MRPDQRAEFQRDRDRILYSSAFRRLSGITQVVRAGEADVFHTRQQHTLKVAQVGRRLAEMCLAQQGEIAGQLHLEPELVEAACLAHDLGHPPFGHIGESALNALVEAAGDPDGYEGNAQSFRILTKLAVRFEECPGLDMTRGTLSATLKYPWLRDKEHPKRRGKWGAYKAEKDDLLFALDGRAEGSRTPEAELMDWADDIAYSVHDLEDFHRCGAVPWHLIFTADRQPAGDTEHIVRATVEQWFEAPPDATGRVRDALRSLQDYLGGMFGDLLSKPYEGTREQRQQLRNMTSQLIGRYIKITRIKEPEIGGDTLDIPPEFLDEVRVLKQIMRYYILQNPSLAAQQRGQQRIIENLFKDIYSDSAKRLPVYLPIRLRYLWDLADGQRARFAADCIACLSEAEAIALHHRLHGLASGSVLDPIVR